MVKLFSKNSNLCDHNSPTSQTDRQTTCDGNTALCTKVHRAVKTKVDQNLLENSLLRECRWLHPGSDVVLMQDSAPSHHAKATQQFLRENRWGFIELLMTGRRILQMSIMGITAFGISCRIWCMKTTTSVHKSTEPQRVCQSIANKWKVISLESVRKSNAQWKRRLNSFNEQNHMARFSTFSLVSMTAESFHVFARVPHSDRINGERS